MNHCTVCKLYMPYWNGPPTPCQDCEQKERDAEDAKLSPAERHANMRGRIWQDEGVDIGACPEVES